MEFKKVIKVSGDDVREITKILNSPGNNTCNVLYTYTAVFNDGIEVDIKVCDTSNDTTPFIDPVIFHYGCEVMSIECRDELLGTYIFKFDNDKYIVEVKQQQEEEKEWDYYFIYLEGCTSSGELYGPFENDEEREYVLLEAQVIHSGYDSIAECVEELKGCDIPCETNDQISNAICDGLEDTWTRFKIQKNARIRV